MTDSPIAKPVYIVDGARTPFLKATGHANPFSASDLAVFAGRDLISRLPINASDIGETIVGCVMPSEDEANIGRLVGLRLGCGNAVPGYSVQRNCASGMQAIDSAIKDIVSGRHDLVLAGGTEAMSRAPLLFPQSAANWFSDFMRAKTPLKKLAVLATFKLRMLVPTIALLHGLSDPLCGIGMGQTAENICYEFDLSREALDEYSFESHQRAAAAYDQHEFKKLVTLYDHNGKTYAEDNGLRRDSSIKLLAKLKPNFDHKYGRITPGNSSQITDGAAMLLLASEEAVMNYKLPVMGRIVDVNWAALSPEVMSLGPVYATTPLMQRQGLSIDDIDYWEINEAFAATVLGCVKAWESEEFCRRELALDVAFGRIDSSRLNVHGGAIALGHPVGASGARIVLQLLEILKAKQARRGIAAICIGGGQGGSMLVERITSHDE